MLRQVIAATTASSNVLLSVAHTLGTTPDSVQFTPMNTAAGVGGLFVQDFNAARVRILDADNSLCSVSILVMAFAGRLY